MQKLYHIYYEVRVKSSNSLIQSGNISAEREINNKDDYCKFDKDLKNHIKSGIHKHGYRNSDFFINIISVNML